MTQATRNSKARTSLPGPHALASPLLANRACESAGGIKTYRNGDYGDVKIHGGNVRLL